MLHAVAAPVAVPRTSVPRSRIVDRLLETDPGLVIIAAPAGYGKTTVLDEWERSDPRPFARLALDAGDNDPARLAARLDRAVAAMRAAPAFVLALDDLECVRSSGSLDTIRALLAELEPGSRLALVSRSAPPLPLARLRANRALTEVTARDLVMTTLEAGALLARARVTATPAMTAELVRKTEGWPAGLALAAATIRGRPDDVAAVAEFGGDDAIVADYVRDEILGSVSADNVTFLTRTSVLEVLSGPACDALLGGDDAARRLSALGRRDMLLVPVDRKDDAYRCHRLVRDMLRAELRRREPHGEALLHTRAAEFFEAAGERDRAVHHAVEAGDAARAARLLRDLAPGHVTPVRDRTLRRRLSRFTEAQAALHPALALATANSDFLRGDLDAVQRWASAVARTLEDAPGALPPEHEAAAALLRAAVAPDGLERMRADAARAYALESSDSPWRAPCCLLEGVALHLTGERAAAELRLEEGVRRAAVAAPNVQTLCLAQLALLAAEREDWQAGAGYVARAVAQVGHYGLEVHPSSALVFAAQALVDARRGRVAEAKDALGTGRRLLESLVDFAPWYEVEARLALARAALRLSDVAVARELRTGAARHARRIPEKAVLADWMDEVTALGDAAATSAAGGGQATLTIAELRVLTFLPTHLSFREIAQRLYVSANTVKTQAHAIYRKLDAVSRSEAVSRAAELGLLDNTVL